MYLDFFSIFSKSIKKDIQIFIISKQVIYVTAQAIFFEQTHLMPSNDTNKKKNLVLVIQ